MRNQPNELVSFGSQQQVISMPHVVQFAIRILWELMLTDKYDEQFTSHPASKNYPFGGVPRLLCPDFRAAKIRWRETTHVSGHADADIGGREVVLEQDAGHSIGLEVFCRPDFYYVRWVYVHFPPACAVHCPVEIRVDRV